MAHSKAEQVSQTYKGWVGTHGCDTITGPGEHSCWLTGCHAPSSQFSAPPGTGTGWVFRPHHWLPVLATYVAGPDAKKKVRTSVFKVIKNSKVVTTEREMSTGCVLLSREPRAPGAPRKPILLASPSGCLLWLLSQDFLTLTPPCDLTRNSFLLSSTCKCLYITPLQIITNMAFQFHK